MDLSRGGRLALICVGLFGIWAAPSVAGPNAGGVVILHCNPVLEFTSPSFNYCGHSDLSECSQAVTRIDSSVPAVFFAFAAFPENVNPRVQGIAVGVDYDSTVTPLVGWGHCSDDSWSDPGWPSPGTGMVVRWDEARTERFFEFYWFAAYDYGAAPSVFRLAAYPGLGAGWFVDDSPAGEEDPVEGYGQLGFFTDGYNPCSMFPTPADRPTWGRLKATYADR